MPEVDALYALYRDRVRVVAVATGDADHIERLRASKELALPVPLATDAFLEAFDVEAFPETLIVDRQGRVAVRLLGGEELPWFEAQVTALLAEADAPLVEAPAPAGTEATGRHGFIARLVYRLGGHGRRGDGEAP